jgi:hypothetical protein
MIIKRSSKYNASGEFWHDGRKVDINRICGGVSFHGPIKFALVLGEEQFFQETHYFILAEGETGQDESLADVLDICRRFDAEYKNQRWFGWLDTNVQQALAVCNKQLYNTGVRNVVVMDVPRVGEWIDTQISAVHMLVRPSQKRLHLYEESLVKSELLTLPSSDIRADKYPRATALSNVVNGMLQYSGESEQQGFDPDPEPMY